ncbi:MAG: hypothetical protein K1X78_20480 [Verrucomicrobiaceae bacterium]|nr:hypothetical protein [Verrucomicrobiaceae bacterium]
MKTLASLLLIMASSAFAGTPYAKNPKAPALPPPDCPPISYSYAELGYIHQQLDHLGHADGAFLDLSHTLVDKLFWEGSATITGGDVDFQSYGTGLGYAIPFVKHCDFVARTGWSYSDSNRAGGEHEWYLSPGIRALVTCDLEFYAKAYYHVSEDENTWSGGVGFVYAVTPNVGLDLGGAIGEDGDWHAQFGIRYNF